MWSLLYPSWINFTGFLLFWTEKIPWPFHDFSSFFSKFSGIMSLFLKLSPNCFEICKVTQFHLNKKCTISTILQIIFWKIIINCTLGPPNLELRESFCCPPSFSRFHIISPWFLLIVQNSMIFPGFPGVLSFFQVFHVEWEPWQNPCNKDTHCVLFHCATHFSLVFLWYKGLALWFGLRGYITFLSVFLLVTRWIIAKKWSHFKIRSIEVCLE